MSKRLSRVMRPHFVSGFFQPDDVKVGYREQTPEEAKVWDGGGLISRRMLKKMVLSDDLTPAKRERLETELRYARRVEFTVMTDRGHAIVADDLRDEQGNPVDFLLPRDTKKEVALGTGRSSQLLPCVDFYGGTTVFWWYWMVKRYAARFHLARGRGFIY